MSLNTSLNNTEKCSKNTERGKEDVQYRLTPKPQEPIPRFMNFFIIWVENT